MEDPTDGAAERFEGYAATITDAYDFGEGDVVIVISNSGINPVPIEVAMEVAQRRTNRGEPPRDDTIGVCHGRW